MRCYIFTVDDRGRTLNAQEIDCNNADEALQLGSAAVADDHFEVWCGLRRLARFEPERRQERPLSRLAQRLTLAERRLREAEQHIRQQERVIAQRKRDIGRLNVWLVLSQIEVLVDDLATATSSRVAFDPPRTGSSI
jgi:hypothetical protein